MPATRKVYLPHTINLYKQMKEEAVRRSVDGKTRVVWQGKMTEIQRKVGVPVPYYSKVLRAMEAMGCITQYRRGSRTVLSVWLLHKAPTAKLYDSVDLTALDTVRSQKVDAIAQRVDDILERLGSTDYKGILIDLGKENESNKAEITKLKKRIKVLEDAVIQ